MNIMSPVVAQGLPHRSEKFDNVGSRGLTVISSRSVSGTNGWNFAIDGVAIIGESVVATPEDILETVARHKFDNPNDFADWWGSNSKNPHVLYFWDAKVDNVYMAPDPLGAALVFCYKSGDVALYSSDLQALIMVAKEYSLPLTKSLEFQLQRIALGNGGYDSTPYTEISSLDAFEYLRIDSEGSHSTRYGIISGLSKPYSYLDGLDATRAEIRSSVRAVAKYQAKTKIAHVTGGFDSRLLLSAITELKLEDEFQFFCSGPTGTADRVIADAITVDYKLRRTNKAGLSSGPTKNLLEQLVAPLFFSEGIASTGPNGRELPSGILAVGGGYGGLLRSTFGTRMQGLDATSSAIEIFNKFDPYYNHSQSVLSDEMFDNLIHRMKAEWTKLSSFYGDASKYGDALYLHVRNRYHFGQNAMQWSRIGLRLDPLYSVHGYFLNLRGTQDLRDSNILGYDLLSSFNTTLMNLPYDKPKFNHPIITAMRPQPPLRDLKKWLPETYTDVETPSFSEQPVLPESVTKYAENLVKVSPEMRKKYINEANRIGLNYWQIESLAPAQRILKSILSSDSSEVIKSGMDFNYLSKLANDRLTNRTQIRNLYTALGTTLWISS